MSPTFINLLSGLGGIIAAVIGFLGGRLTQREAAKAKRATQEIERSKIDAQAYSEGRRIWDGIINDLQETTADQRHQIGGLRRDFESQKTRLEDLEHKRAGDRRAIHLLTEYVRRLLRVIADNELVPPAPPKGLDLE